MPRAKRPVSLRVKRIDFGNWGIYKESRKTPIASQFDTQEWAEDVAREMARDIVNSENRNVTVFTHGVRGHVRRRKTFHAQ